MIFDAVNLDFKFDFYFQSDKKNGWTNVGDLEGCVHFKIGAKIHFEQLCVFNYLEIVSAHLIKTVLFSGIVPMVSHRNDSVKKLKSCDAGYSLYEDYEEY